MKKVTLLLALFTIVISACDDGSVEEKAFVDETDGYNVVLTGTLTGGNTWSGNYNVVIAGFDNESDYSLIQKSLPLSLDDTTPTNVTLTHISKSAKTIEIAAVNDLRARINTFYSFTIPDNQRTDDTIRINVENLDISMFTAINQGVFNSSFFSCSRCHSSERAVANLDLSVANSYANLINVTSSHDSSQKRVVPGNAENSYLLQVLTDGRGIGYSHPALFTEDSHSRMLNLIKTWIDNGAKK